MKHANDFKIKLEEIKNDLTKVENPTTDQKKDLEKINEFLADFDNKVKKIKGIEIGKSEFLYVLGTKLKLNGFSSFR